MYVIENVKLSDLKALHARSMNIFDDAFDVGQVRRSYMVGFMCPQHGLIAAAGFAPKSTPLEGAGPVPFYEVWLLMTRELSSRLVPFVRLSRRILREFVEETGGIVLAMTATREGERLAECCGMKLFGSKTFDFLARYNLELYEYGAHHG